MHVEKIRIDTHEDVRLFIDHESGLKAIIALHNTLLGPAIGGCRFMDYDDLEAALADALRLAEAMSRKTAMACLPFGGGKSVIIGDPSKLKSPKLMRAFGHAVAGFDGNYYTGEDVGTTPVDMDEASIESPYVLGCSNGAGHLQAHLTAIGTHLGIKTALRHRFGTPDLTDRTIAIQGLGQTGMALARLLVSERAHLVVADTDKEKCTQARNELGAKIVPPKEIMFWAADVFAPCALGDLFNAETVGQMKTPIVAGCANNQLVDLEAGQMLADRNILHAPDFIINAGGVINAAHEAMPGGYSRQMAEKHLGIIRQRLDEIFEISKRKCLSTTDLAIMKADQLMRPNAIAA